jgi:Fusaric acid resistance protein-like
LTPARAARTVAPLPAEGLWAEAFRVQRRGGDVVAGLAGALATCGPLALGIALDEPQIGVTAALGGLNGALVIPRGRLRDRVGWGLGATLGYCASGAAAMAVQGSVAASVASAFVVVGLTAYMRTFGFTGSLTGFVIGVMFVILSGIPGGSLDLGERVLWFAVGSLVGVALMVTALARDAPPPSPDARPLLTVLTEGVRQYVRALADDKELRGHALRLASIVALTTLCYRLLDLQHGYWVPLTVLAVLQPEEHASRVRAVQRAVGTLVATAAIAVFVLASSAQWVIVAGQGVAAFGLFTLHSRSYYWLVVMITPTALLTFTAIDYQGDEIALERAAWSALGILVGLAIAEAVWRFNGIRPPRGLYPRHGREPARRQ